jgi:Flp pilus assembly CpaF family ATPase
VVIGASLGLFTATSLIGLEWRSRVNATATPTATAAPTASVLQPAVRPQARAGIAAFGATSRKCAPVVSVTAAIRP